MIRLGLICITSLCFAGCTGDMKNVGDLDGGSSDDTTTGDDATSSASMSSTTASTTAGTASSTTDATTTTTATATGSDGTDTSVDCLPQGESVCDPAPMDVDARFVIDDDEFPFDNDEHSEACTVAAVTEQGPNDLPRITLDCVDAQQQQVQHTIDVTVSSATLGLLTDGMSVHFDYIIETPWWSNRWFAIRDGSDALLIGGQDANSFDAPIDCIPEQPEQCNLYRPLMLEVSTDVCDTDPPTCNVPDPCYLVRRQAIAASDGTLETPIEVFDRGMSQVADYELRVGEAAAWEDVLCTDTPSSWYRFVAARLP